MLLARTFALTIWSFGLREYISRRTVVVTGPAHPEVRRALPAAIKARFGVNLEYIGGPASARVGKMKAERAAGIYSFDVTLAGIQSMAQIFHREGLLEPLKPLLVLPGVLDGAKWKRGSLCFMDPEQHSKSTDVSSLALTHA